MSAPSLQAMTATERCRQPLTVSTLSPGPHEVADPLSTDLRTSALRRLVTVEPQRRPVPLFPLWVRPNRAAAATCAPRPLVPNSVILSLNKPDKVIRKSASKSGARAPCPWSKSTLRTRAANRCVKSAGIGPVWIIDAARRCQPAEGRQRQPSKVSDAKYRHANIIRRSPSLIRDTRPTPAAGQRRCSPYGSPRRRSQSS